MNIADGQSIGVLVGSEKDFGMLRAVVAFAERDRIPPLGAFLIVEAGSSGPRYVVRVEQIDYTDYHTTQERREQALVDAYLQRIRKYGSRGNLTQEEKDALFFYRLTLRVLGRLERDAKGETFRPGLRALPPLTSNLRYPREEELEFLLAPRVSELPRSEEESAAKEQETKASPKEERISHRQALDQEEEARWPRAVIGYFVLGEQKFRYPIRFAPRRFERRRTAVFARTGYGKSNLSKVLIAMAGWAAESGLLILDVDGEYVMGSGKPGDLGLAHLPFLQHRLTVFSPRAEYLRTQFDWLDAHGLLDLSHLYGSEIASLLRYTSEGEKATVGDLSWKLADAETARLWGEYLKVVHQTRNDRSPDARKKRKDALEKLLRKMVSDEKHWGPLRRVLPRLAYLHQPTGENAVEAIRKALQKRRIVVLDLSGMPMDLAFGLADVVLYRLFQYALDRFAEGEEFPVIAVFEEAQNLLREAKISGSVFVRWAKEGRKLGLGLIYITQQPGAISPEIVSQTDNFFVMHLLSKRDTGALVQANPHYAGVIENFLLRETVVGNAYVYSAPRQPYVYPLQVLHFPVLKKGRVWGLEGFRWDDLLKQIDSSEIARKKEISKAVGYTSYRWFDYLKSLGQQKEGEDFLWPDWMKEKNLDYSIAEAMLIHLCVLYPDHMKPVLQKYGNAFLKEYRHIALKKVLEKLSETHRASAEEKQIANELSDFENEEIPF